MPVLASRQPLLVPSVELEGELRFRLDGEDCTAVLVRAFYSPPSLAAALREAMRAALPVPEDETDCGFRLHFILAAALSGGEAVNTGGALVWTNTSAGLPLTILHSSPLSRIETPDGWPLVAGDAAHADLAVAPGSRVQWTHAGDAVPNPVQPCQFVWPQLRGRTRLPERRITGDFSTRTHAQAEDGRLWPVARGAQRRWELSFGPLSAADWQKHGWDRTTGSGGALELGSMMTFFPDPGREAALPVRPLNRTIEVERTVPGYRSVKLQLAAQPLPDGGGFTCGREFSVETVSGSLTETFGGDTAHFSADGGALKQAGATPSPASAFVRLWPLDESLHSSNLLASVKLWRTFPFVASGSGWEAGIALSHTSGKAGVAVTASEGPAHRELRAWAIHTGGSKSPHVTLGVLRGNIPRSEGMQERPDRRFIARFWYVPLGSGAALTRVRAWYNGEGPFDGQVMHGFDTGGGDLAWMPVCSNGTSPASTTWWKAFRFHEDASGWLGPDGLPLLLGSVENI